MDANAKMQTSRGGIGTTKTLDVLRVACLLACLLGQAATSQLASQSYTLPRRPYNLDLRYVDTRLVLPWPRPHSQMGVEQN